MEKNLLRTTILLLSFVVAIPAAKAQKNQTQTDTILQLNTITTAVPFLLIAPDSRGGGMGDIGVASSPDANSIHWNPAKLAFIQDDLGFSMSVTPWLRNLVPDINLYYLSGYRKLGNNPTLGASLRYFSLGDITFTDNTGNVIGQYKPHEFAVDVAYARKLCEETSAGLALRDIYSNLTVGIHVQNAESKAGTSVATDISVYYEKEIELGKKDAIMAFGTNISNIGAKMSYTETGNKNFIPINWRLGGSTRINLDEFNQLGILLDFNKLLVPTPPVYAKDAQGNPIIDPNGNPVISHGKDPDVPVVAGMFQSFGDAPGGFKEEVREINISLGLEYWYDQQFAFRTGYFYEHASKGNRKFFTLGAGLKYNVFGLNFAYLIPTEQTNPLEGTIRFSLLFNWVKGAKATTPAE
ncbi:MAG: type IX secretion system outer membrane channel protein PorV [Bacteroidia bacterium]